MRLRIIVVCIIKHRLQLEFFLLTRVYKQNFCTTLKCEQFHLFIDESHRRGNHFAVLKQESHDICCCAI